MSAVGSIARGEQVSAVGRLLRDWRMARGISQLDLALQAGFSARHISFIETGRTQPSRHALLALAETLEMPLRDRNRLLQAAGYAPVYRHTALEAEEMTHVRRVLEFILERHKPYAAVVHDRYTNCIMGNGASANLIAAIVDASLLVEPVNYLRIAFHPLGARRWIVNWDEVARQLLSRAERELGSMTDDSTARVLLEEIHHHAGRSVPPPAALRPSADLLLPIHIKKDDLELRLFSTIMTLGTPQDVTLQELHIETFFPADEASERAWRRVTGDA
jgi:transcriptional regulator with XRE-family HTH domain